MSLLCILLVKATKPAKIQGLGKHTSPLHVRSDSYVQGGEGLLGAVSGD